MSKSNVLELAKKLVAAIEKEDQKNKVMLKDIPVGGKFDTGIGRFIVLEQKENYTAVITEDLYREDVKFDDDCTDYKKCSLKQIERISRIIKEIDLRCRQRQLHIAMNYFST